MPRPHPPPAVVSPETPRARPVPARSADRPVLLYLHMIATDSCQRAKLAGMRRYAAAHGWRVEALRREASRSWMIPGVLARHRPIGCIVEGAGRWDDLPPDLFGSTPVVYADVLDETVCRGNPRVILDPDLVARTAMRELSALEPAAYAAVGFVRPHEWSRHRLLAFVSLVRARGRECLLMEARRGEGVKSYISRINAWVASLPRSCAIFAVQGPTAFNVAAAARAGARTIPRDLALLTTGGMEKDAIPLPAGISVIQFDFERLGYLAARTLVEWKLGRLGPGFVERLGPLYVVRKESTQGRGRREAHILEALEMIRAEACSGLTSRALAARFPCSRRLFDMRFREAVGHSVLDEILHVRMERVRTLLAQTDTAIGAIPGLCGFGTESDLDILFRRRTGLSMRAWRKLNSWRQKNSFLKIQTFSQEKE